MNESGDRDAEDLQHHFRDLFDWEVMECLHETNHGVFANFLRCEKERVEDETYA
jgi:hypothetical protein